MTGNYQGRPCKHGDEWATRIDIPLYAVVKGHLITITTRAGKSWEARVDKVLGRGYVVVSTSPLDSYPQPELGGENYDDPEDIYNSDEDSLMAWRDISL